MRPIYFIKENNQQQQLQHQNSNDETNSISRHQQRSSNNRSSSVASSQPKQQRQQHQQQQTVSIVTQLIPCGISSLSKIESIDCAVTANGKLFGYTSHSLNNNNATGSNGVGGVGGGSLSNLSSYSSANSTCTSLSPSYFPLISPKSMANLTLSTCLSLNHHNEQKAVSLHHQTSEASNSNNNDLVDTTSLFSPSKICKLERQLKRKKLAEMHNQFQREDNCNEKENNNNNNNNNNNSSSSSKRSSRKTANDKSSSSSHQLVDNSESMISYSRKQLDMNNNNKENTRKQIRGDAFEHPTNDNNNNYLNGESTKTSKGLTTISTNTTANLSSSKVRVMSTENESSPSKHSEEKAQEEQQQQQTSQEEAVPAVPATSPPESPSKTISITKTSSTTVTTSKTAAATASPSHLNLADKRGATTINKSVVSQPISYPTAVATTGSSSSSSNTTSPYKSNISPRQTVISRRTDRNATSSLVHHTSNYGSSAISSYPIAMRPTGGAHSAAGNALRETRQNEKKQLSELNDRFAGYVERVRFLEAQNKKLQIELDVLKSKWGQETKYIEKMYQIELEEARSVLNDTAKTKDGLQVKLDRSEQELDEMKKRYFEVEGLLNRDKEKITSLQDQIAANESEIGLLRRRLGDLQDEEKRYKAEAQRMMSEIQRVSFELECEIKQRLSLENDKQSLEEELLFLKEIHTKELEELKHLSLRESGIDPSAFFKSELSTAIKEIRDEYESLNQAQRNELEGWYRMKVSEIQRKNAHAITSARPAESELNREQAKKLKLQITDSKKNISDLKAKNAELESRIKDLEDEIKREESESHQMISGKEIEIQILKEELNKIVAEYDDLMTTKSDLEVEIRTYRKLLEGEENREGLKQIVETIEHRARTMGSNSNVNAASSGTEQRDSSPFYKAGLNKLTSRLESSPRRFGGFLPMSRSHDDSIERLARKNNSAKASGKNAEASASPFRRSILEANEAEADSSAAEDNVDENKSGADKQPSTDEAAADETNQSADAVAAASGNEKAAPKEKDYGQILVSIHYDSPRSKLVVKIVQASKLINTDKDSLSDPYARVILLPDRTKKSKRKTKIIKDTLAPQWDEAFEYDMSLADAKLRSIDLVVKNDKSLFSREKTFMGKCLIQLDQIENLEIGATEWYKLEEESIFDAIVKKLNEVKL